MRILLTLHGRVVLSVLTLAFMYAQENGVLFVVESLQCAAEFSLAGIFKTS